MRALHVLLVDDEERERKRAVKLNAHPEIEVTTAESLAEAREHLEQTFFHLALVDLQLDSKKVDNVDGQALLTELALGRPSCRRVLFTGESERHREALFSLISLDGPIIHGALNKSDFSQAWDTWLLNYAREFAAAENIVLGDLQPVIDDIGQEVSGSDAFGGASAKVSPEEIRHVVERLLAAPASKMFYGDAHASIEFEPLADGLSSASVYLVHVSRQARENKLVWVLKIGPLPELHQEHERYERFVKYRLSTVRRAELLEYYPGDTVGAILYAFAGSSPRSVSSLNALFEAESPRALQVISEVLDSSHDDLWGQAQVSDDDLGAFMYQTYNSLEGKDESAQVYEFLTNRLGDLGLKLSKAGLLDEDDQKFPWPTEAFFGTAARPPFHSSVIHGDLNPRNILIADDQHVRLIDFRHANVGPVAVDCAALEVGVRLACPGEQLSLTRLSALEGRVLSRVWTAKPAHPKAPPLPYWGTVSERLAERAKTLVPGMSSDEYWASCLLYALRILRSDDLEETDRLRLVAFVSGLYRLLDV